MLLASLCFAHCVAGTILLNLCGLLVLNRRFREARTAVRAWLRCYGPNCIRFRLPQGARPQALPGAVRVRPLVLALAALYRTALDPG
jgi:hypothetical protein